MVFYRILDFSINFTGLKVFPIMKNYNKDFSMEFRGSMVFYCTLSFS